MHVGNDRHIAFLVAQLQGILNERVRKEVKYELVLDESGTKYDKIPRSKVPNIEIETEDSFDDDQDF